MKQQQNKEVFLVKVIWVVTMLALLIMDRLIQITQIQLDGISSKGIIENNTNK